VKERKCAVMGKESHLIELKGVESEKVRDRKRKCGSCGVGVVDTWGGRGDNTFFPDWGGIRREQKGGKEIFSQEEGGKIKE